MPTTNLFTENFDGVTAPAFPSGYTTGGTWLTSTTQHHNGANSAKTSTRSAFATLMRTGGGTFATDYGQHELWWYNGHTGAGLLTRADIFLQNSDQSVYEEIFIRNYDSDAAGNGVIIHDSADGGAARAHLAGNLFGAEWHYILMKHDGTTLAVTIARASDGFYLNSSGTWQSGGTTCYSASSHVTGLDRATISLYVDTGDGDSYYDGWIADDISPSTPLAGGTIAAGTTTATTQALTRSVAVSGGTGPYTYQWYRKLGAGSFSAVAGATSATLTDTGLTPGAAYSWKCTATDSAGTPATADSNTVTATMDTALAAGSITPGTPAASTCTLTSSAATHGTPSYTYQWYRSTSTGFTPGVGNIISGATSLTLNDSGLTPTTTYFYKVVATDATTTAITSQATITTTALQTVMQIDATSGLTIYARVMSQYGQYANGTTLENFTSGHITNYKIACTEDGTTGHYQGTFPAVIAGLYAVTFFHQAGGSAAQGDSAVGAGNLQWDGTKEVSVLPTEAGGSGSDTSGVTTLLTRIPGNLTITGGKVDVNDKTGFSLSVAGILAFWNQLLSDAGIVSGSVIKKLKDWVYGTDGKGLLSSDAQAAQTFNLTGNITGNLSGSVASVTGAVGSVTGNVGGNVAGSVGSIGSLSTGAITAAAISAGAASKIAKEARSYTLVDNGDGTGVVTYQDASTADVTIDTTTGFITAVVPN